MKEAEVMSDKLAAFIQAFPWVHATRIPWAPPIEHLSRATAAVISTGGVYVDGDTPFAIVNRDDVDESYREIPVNTPAGDLRLAHEHYNKDYARKDINTIFPVQRLQQLAQDGMVAEVAPVGFSISGYIPQPSALYSTGRRIAERLAEIGADCALLTPV